jgi:TonB-linked SusC/RagA family outer membrane protein
VYDENGNYFRTAANDYGNPIAIANEVLNTSKTIDVLGTVFANAKITNWLQFRTQLSTKYGNSVGDNYQPATVTFSGAEANGLGSISNYNSNELLNENYFTIDKKFGTDHAVNFVGGFSVQTFESRQSTLTGRNFVNDNLNNENLESAATVAISTPPLQRSTLQSYYGRANYTLKNKYLFTLTGRADGSTKFAKNNKWGYFPSGAVAWKVNEEDFIKKLNIFSEFKLRASYGLTGNQGLSPYNSLERYGSDKYYTGSGFETGFGPGFSLGNDEQGLTILEGLANNSLKWETTKSFDLGVDIGFADQRFTLTLDYYDKRTSDLLRKKFLAPSSAFNQILVNDGEISNRGFEVGVNANIITKPDFTWSLGGNFTLNRNKVVSMGETAKNEVGNYIEMLRQRVNTYTIGYPIFAYYGFESDGIIQTLEEGLAAGLTGADAQPGEVKYKDISGPDGVPDGIINDQYDRKIIGNPTPNFLYSFNTSLKYKNFDLSAQFYGVSGIDVLDLQKLTPSRLVQRWTTDNPSALYPRANNTRGFKASDYFITDGSFLRVQNITVGYNVKKGLIKGINSMRIFLSGNNLYTFTKFNAGFDPEVGEDGINYGSYPRPRAISIGLNVGF